ncbi:hypothetical protein ACU639_27140 [Streptomyces cynarae]|uniref:hypothetical protein n=1 Tax=Streptomyces cynarae TaxID=2981134 RepID=UPI00406CA748
MKLFPNSSGRYASGRTDLQESPETSLHDTRSALIAGVPIQECRVHGALVTYPDVLGLDAIEARSGLGRKTLLGEPGRGTSGILPAEGQSSALLHCISRGVFTEVEDERRPMEVQPLSFSPSGKWSSAHHQTSEGSSNLLPKKGLEATEKKEKKDLGIDNGAQMTTSGQAPWIERYEQLLRPDRDIWANRAVGNREARETPGGPSPWSMASNPSLCP